MGSLELIEFDSEYLSCVQTIAGLISSGFYLLLLIVFKAPT